MGDNFASLMDEACEAVSSNFITVIREASVGSISFGGGATATTTCVDGVADGLMVNAPMTNSSMTGWIITDAATGEILGLPAAPPFNLDGAGPGTCLIYFVGHEADFMGAALGNNISGLTGTFELSNPLTVYREEADGGIVSLLDGSTSYTGTAGDIVFQVQHTNSAPNLPYYYIITDEFDNILEVHPTSAGNILDLSVAPPGICHIWGYSFSNATMPVMGQNVNTLTDEACESISDNFITVNRLAGGGATCLITETPQVICGPNGFFTLWIDWNSANPNPDLLIVDNITNTVVTQTSQSSGTISLGTFAETTGYSYTITDLSLNNCSVTRTVNVVSCTTTPIELVSFTGEVLDNVNEISWITGSERDNDYFTIERSSNGVDFEDIADVASRGDANHIQAYSFEDEEPINEAFYRLSETDVDGKRKVASTVIYLKRNEINFSVVSVAPNPVANTLQLRLESSVDDDLEVQIFNVVGQLVYQESSFVPLGIKTFSIDMSNFSAGSYFLNLVTTQQGAQRIVVQKQN